MIRSAIFVTATDILKCQLPIRKKVVSASLASSRYLLADSIDRLRAQLRIEAGNVIEPFLWATQHIFRILNPQADYLGDLTNEMDAIARVEIVIFAGRIAPRAHESDDFAILRVRDGDCEVPVGVPDVLRLFDRDIVLHRPVQNAGADRFGGKPVILVDDFA